MNDEKTRSIEVTLDLPQPPERVWQAVSQAEEYENWFPLRAQVEPGQGGKVVWSWEEPWEFNMDITIWEPRKKLQLREEKAPQGVKPVPLTVDIELNDNQKGGTTLRLVHSGFGRGADWDEFFEAHQNGWTTELDQLRVYMTHHPGKQRQMAFIRKPMTGISRESVWNQLFATGLLADNRDPATLNREDQVTVRLEAGKEEPALVLINRPHYEITLTLPQRNFSTFRFVIEDGFVVVFFSAWGEAREQVPQVEAVWKQHLDGLAA